MIEQKTYGLLVAPERSGLEGVAKVPPKAPRGSATIEEHRHDPHVAFGRYDLQGVTQLVILGVWICALLEEVFDNVGLASNHGGSQGVAVSAAHIELGAGHDDIRYKTAFPTGNSSLQGIAKAALFFIYVFASVNQLPRLSSSRRTGQLEVDRGGWKGKGRDNGSRGFARMQCYVRT
jgi:hypothetical protein